MKIFWYPPPTTRFSRGLVVNSITKIYIKIIFLPTLKTLVVNLVVLWWKGKYSLPHPHHKIFSWSCGEFYYKNIYKMIFSPRLKTLVVNLAVFWWNYSDTQPTPKDFLVVLWSCGLVAFWPFGLLVLCYILYIIYHIIHTSYISYIINCNIYKI